MLEELQQKLSTTESKLEDFQTKLSETTNQKHQLEEVQLVIILFSGKAGN